MKITVLVISSYKSLNSFSQPSEMMLKTRNGYESIDVL